MQIASKRPAATAGLLLVLSLSAVEGCRSRRPRQGTAADGGAGPAATAWLSGSVVDRRDRPVPEARVLAFALAGDAGAPFETATDLAGRFRLAALPRGAYRLLVEAAGFPTTEVASAAAPGDAGTVRVDGEGHAIVGRVSAGGVPVAGARVLLAPDAGGGPTRESVTRAGGGFAFGGLGAGRYAVRAVGETVVSPTTRAVEAVDRPEDGPPVALAMAPGRAVAGRVIDDAGTALAGVAVRIETDTGAPGDDPLPALVQSDRSGRFSALVSLGSYRVSASRPGYVLRRAPAADARAAGAPVDVVLELVRGARVFGKVVDPRGGAAAGARVRCLASAIEDLTVQTGPLPLAAEAAAMPSGAGRALGSTRATVADREGRFAVDDLIPGRYRIEVAQGGAEPLRTDEFVLAPGERRDAGKLALRPGFPVTGRVVDESGSPIEGARVVVAAGGASPASVGLFAMTDGAGHFSLALPAGSHRLSASASGRGTAQASVDVAAGSSPPAVQFKLARAEARLEGLIRDDGGRPLARARLAVWPAGAVEAPPVPGAAPIASGVGDVGGHFTIAPLPAGEARLEIQHPDYPTSVHPVTPGKYANITVPFPGGVAGEVKAKTTGAAVARGRLEAVGPGGARATADLRRDGTFRLMRLVPGRWRLTVVATGYRQAEQELEVPASSNLGEASIRSLRVELEPS
jgi:protocatechuate 3,4-dioxygenase beta subunit